MNDTNKLDITARTLAKLHDLRCQEVILSRRIAKDELRLVRMQQQIALLSSITDEVAMEARQARDHK